MRLKTLWHADCKDKVCLHRSRTNDKCVDNSLIKYQSIIPSSSLLLGILVLYELNVIHTPQLLLNVLAASGQ